MSSQSFIQLGGPFLNVTLANHFSLFKKQYNKQYSSKNEELKRFAIFANTFQAIEDVNNQDKPYKLAVYEFADLTEQEFAQKYLRKPEKITFSGSVDQNIKYNLKDNEVDWQALGLIARVKDQGTCGSCWAFGAIGAAEMIYNKQSNRKFKDFIELSEQDLVDCCHAENTNGCNGGEPIDAMTCLTSGVASEKDYPYLAYDSQCADIKKEFASKGYVQIEKGNNEELLIVLLNQAIDIGVNAAAFNFRFFKSGVITDGCTWTSIDHDVLLAGSGNVGGIDYWKIKNSWGKNWGQDGYLYVLREHGKKPALCGLNMKAFYPTV